MKYLKLLRVKSWIKNILIVLPILCAHELNDNNIINTIIAFISFCFASSFVYILNDIKDKENDRKHISKKNRPIASGSIEVKTAAVIAVILLIISILLTLYINNFKINNSLYLLISYIVINIGYSLGLKNIEIVDVSILSLCYIIRVYYGASIFNIEVSSWLFLTILSASLYLGLSKRKKELQISTDTRKVLNKYNENFLDKFAYLSLTLTIVFYSLWSIEQTSKYVIFTVPLLIIIFMKYSLDIEKGEEGDPTNIIYNDKVLIVLTMAYAITMIIIMM